MIIGLAGTRFGGNSLQLLGLEELWAFLRPHELHHGDCDGVDAEGHDLMRRLDPSVTIHAHPPTNELWRAFRTADVTWKPLPYLDRTLVIVQSVNVMCVVPAEEDERLRSGTWAAVRYAMHAAVPLYVLLPSGRVEVRQ
jgi:hypothetical protein